MADSVALLRLKIEDVALAVQDETINSVITLAAIEFGKGNVQVSQMHVEGARLLVRLRGGIDAVYTTNPLTARMVAWVSMIITGKPQFETQNDYGEGDGIPPIPGWQSDMTSVAVDIPELRLDNMGIERGVQNVLNRLHEIFQSARHSPLPPTRLHELTSFAIHRLLSNYDATSPLSPGNECLRLGIVLYLFTVQGQAYFPHTVMANDIAERFHQNLVSLEATPRRSDSLDIWCVSIGMAVSAVASKQEWYFRKAREWAESLQLRCWDDVMVHIKRILWLDSPHGVSIFRPYWEACFHRIEKVS